MFDIQIKITYTTGLEQTVTVLPKDAVALEEKYDVSFFEAFNSERTRLSWLYFLAWSASVNPPKFGMWMKTVLAIDVIYNGESLFEKAAEQTTV